MHAPYVSPPPTTHSATAQRAQAWLRPEASRPTSGPPSAEIRIGEGGRIHGVDGMLDQVAGALTRRAMVDAYPIIRQDRQLQARIGQAVGAAVARELSPLVWLGVGSLATIAALQLARWLEGRGQGSGVRGRRR